MTELPADLATGKGFSHGLRQLADAAGVEAALKIALARGGTRLYIPKRAEGTVLESLAGIDAARAIVAQFGGEIIEVPLAKRQLNVWLRSAGWSQTRRGAVLKVARSTVKSWDAGSRPSRRRKR